MTLMRNPIQLFTLFTILFTSCNLMNCPDKDTFISSYLSFVEEVKSLNQKNNVSWEQTDAQFEDYVDRCYPAFKHQFSNEDAKKFWSSTVKYYYNRYNGDLSEAFDHAEKQFSEDFENDMQKYLDQIDDDAIGFFKEIFKDDIKKGVDGVLDFLNELGNEIKQEVDNKK